MTTFSLKHIILSLKSSDSPELPEADVEELAKVLHVKSIDLCISENTVAHRTDKYDIVKEREEMKDDKPTGKMLEPELVLRRGQDFNLSIEFDRPYHKDKNDLELVFKTGKSDYRQLMKSFQKCWILKK